MLDKSKLNTEQREQVVIKKYANRRLYNTESSTYVTLEDLAQMVRDDRDFIVFDAKSGDDLTHAVLTQIIVEQESREGGPNLLPIPFLRQLIRFYDDSMGNMVPGYLQFSMEALTQKQDEYRSKFADAWGARGLESYQDQARNNLQIFEQAMSMWTPFKTADGGAASDGQLDRDTSTKADQPNKGTNASSNANSDASTQPRQANEIDALKAELEAMQHRIEKLSEKR
jgi:polyhydroxyalkanoate synthesis repressor PhaR